MAKKKTTMTLKDFHGGSIPSDLPLPSAPGLSARPPDRPAPWGPPALSAASAASRAPDHQPLRPGSAGGPVANAAGALPGRGFDERPPAFLSIGRHFDEDERKPFDASSAPRRASAADPARTAPLPAAVNAVGDRSGVKRVVSGPVAYSPGPGAGVSGGSVAAPNAWGVRKESVSVGVGVGVGVSEPLAHVPWSASRLAQTSAVEKVLSGRWQSKPPDVEVVRSQEVEVLEQRVGEGGRVVEDGERRYYESERPRSGSAVVYGDGKERNLQGSYSDRSRGDQEKGRYGMYQEGKERSLAAGSHSSGVRPASAEGRFNASKVQQQGVGEVQDRPKLKLLPRTKQFESSDTHAPVFEEKQVLSFSPLNYRSGLIVVQEMIILHFSNWIEGVMEGPVGSI